jgi:hypothetical protein
MGYDSIKIGEQMKRRKPVQHEAMFVKDFAVACRYNGALLVDIPDAIIFRGQKTITEKRRPADSVLITPNGLFLIEFKANRTQQSQHQKQSEKLFNRVNNKAYYVVRRSLRKNRNTGAVSYVYTVEQNLQKIYQTSCIIDLVNYFKGKGYEDDFDRCANGNSGKHTSTD